MCRIYEKFSLIYEVGIFYICHLCRIGQDIFLNIRHQKFQYAKSLEIQENTKINRALLEPLFRAVLKKSGLYLAIPFIAIQNTDQNTGQKYTKSKTGKRILSRCRATES